VVSYLESDLAYGAPPITPGDGELAVVDEVEDSPLLTPVTPNLSWAGVHADTQTMLRPGFASPSHRSVTTMRRTATIRRGTRMIKLLSGRQLIAYLHGRLPRGFCYRASDLEGLRIPDDLAMLTGDLTRFNPDRVIFGVRWRAVDPADYDIPFSVLVDDLPAYPGLTEISPHDRVGPAVLGTGFAPSEHHLVPEFVTADLADLPMPAGSSLVAFAPDGTEVSLFLYVPEQRAWTRMFGPHWRHLLAAVPEVQLDQDYFQIPAGQPEGSTLLGRFQGQTYPALADPPHEFRVLAKVRAARYPVDALARRTTYARWRGAECTIVGVDGQWRRLRLCRPNADSAPNLGVECVERGVHEVWVAEFDLDDVREVDLTYAL
jgi:hypothetical protein